MRYIAVDADIDNLKDIYNAFICVVLPDWDVDMDNLKGIYNYYCDRPGNG